MRLRLLARADLEAVRQLRNQHREFFFDTREITTDQQQAWFEDLGQKPIAFYVIEQDGRVVGTISVTDGSDGREIIDALVDAQALRATGNFGEPVVVAIDPQTSWAQSAHRGPNFESELRQALEMAKLLVPASPTEELVPAGEQSLAEVG